ncbi:esterase/lipase [Effusibacillus lacus]|nr:esterase/lipase [Effusibacillus lacus]
MEPLANYLRSLGHEVHTPTLAGHGGTRKDMKQFGWQDWVQSAEEVLLRLLSQGKRVHVMGFSMGGLIAAHLAAKYPVRSLTMLSSPIYYVNRRQLVRTVAEAVQHRVKAFRDNPRIFRGKAHEDGGDPGAKDIQRYAMRIRITPLKAILNFQKLVRALKPDLKRVEVPTMIIQGEKEDLVQTRSAWYIYNAVRSKEKKIHFLGDSRHMICLGRDQAEVCRLVADFITGHGGKDDES